MPVYHISQSELTEFCPPEKPFVSFDQFGNIVKQYRDFRYALENISGFADDIGVAYNLWTVSANSRYRRNLFLNEVPNGIYAALSVPSLDSNAVFSLKVSIFDDEGEYFSQHQEIAVEKHILAGEKDRRGHFRLVSWRKIDTIRNFVTSEFERFAMSPGRQ